MQRKLIGSTLGLLAAATLLVAGSGTASAVPIQWWDGQGANGHFYELRGGAFADGPGTDNAANLTWANAQAAAAADTSIPGFQASLVTITSQRELDFLVTASGLNNHGVIGANIQAVQAWIGLNDPGADDNVYEWVPVTVGLGSTTVQEPFNFNNWAANEPDGGAEPVVRMNSSGEWFDSSDGIRHYIFEWSPVPEPGSMVLCSLGALAMAGYGWRRRRNRAKAAK